MFTNRITFTIEKALTPCFIQQQLTVTTIRNATFRHHQKLWKLSQLITNSLKSVQQFHNLHQVKDNNIRITIEIDPIPTKFRRRAISNQPQHRKRQ